MITKMTLKNFKLHKKTELKMAPITVFIGPNNSGKSSIFQALLCLKQAAKYSYPGSIGSFQFIPLPSENRRDIIDVGEFRHVVREGEEQISLSLAGSIGSKFFGEIKLDAEWSFTNNVFSYLKVTLMLPQNFLHPLVHHYTSRPIEWQLIKMPNGAVKVSAQPENFALNGIDFKLQGELQGGMNLAGLFILPYFGISPSSEMPTEKTAEIIDISREVFESLRKIILSVHHVYAIRGMEGWGFPLPDRSEENLEFSLLSERTSSLISILSYDEKTKAEISDWMQGILNAKLTTELVPGRKILIKTDKTLLANEGTGAQQMPFILAPIALTPKTETILLSEPEAHLHPKAQSDLAEIFIKVWQKEQKQFLIETHSEHILTAFLNAVAKGKLSKNDFSIYYFENQNGTACARALNVDEKGRVEGGLPGFFEQTLQEMIDFLEASEPNRS